MTTRLIVPWDILLNPSLMFGQFYLRNITSTKLQIKHWIRVLPLLYLLILQAAVSKIYCVHPYFGEMVQLTSIFFQMGWFNHQLVFVVCEWNKEKSPFK